MPQSKRKSKPGPKADALKIDLAPQEALRRLLAAPPEKKHRVNPKKGRRIQSSQRAK